MKNKVVIDNEDRIFGRGRDTVSRYVHEYEAAVSAAGYILNAQTT